MQRIASWLGGWDITTLSWSENVEWLGDSPYGCLINKTSAGLVGLRQRPFDVRGLANLVQQGAGTVYFATRIDM